MSDEHNEENSQAVSLLAAIPAEPTAAAQFVRHLEVPMSDVERAHELAQGIMPNISSQLSARIGAEIADRFNLSKSILDKQNSQLVSLIDQYAAQSKLPVEPDYKIDPTLYKVRPSEAEVQRAQREKQQLEILQGMLAAVEQSQQTAAAALAEAKASTAEAKTTKRINWAVLAVAGATLIVAIVAIFVTVAVASS